VENNCGLNWHWRVEVSSVGEQVKTKPQTKVREVAITAAAPSSTASKSNGLTSADSELDEHSGDDNNADYENSEDDQCTVSF